MKVRKIPPNQTNPDCRLTLIRKGTVYRLKTLNAGYIGTETAKIATIIKETNSILYTIQTQPMWTLD